MYNVLKSVDLESLDGLRLSGNIDFFFQTSVFISALRLILNVQAIESVYNRPFVVRIYPRLSYYCNC